MKKLFVLLILLASVAGAQIVPAGSGNTAIGSGSPVSGCTSSILYADAASLLKCDPAAVVNGSSTAASRSILTIRDTISGSSATSNFLNITGTFPSPITSETSGAYLSFGLQDNAQIQYGLQTLVSGVINGGTRASATYSKISAAQGSTNNLSAGTVTAGIFGEMASIPTTGVAVFGLASGAATNSVGVSGSATGGTNRVGVTGQATGGTSNIGGYFGLNSGTPTLTTAGALIADNGAVAADIFSARDNGTAVQIVQDGGSLYSKMGTKALTLGGGAVTFVRVAVASNSFQGGFIDWCADANDATDYQTRCGILPFSIVNKGGTETCTVGTPDAGTESVAASAGTFTVAFTTDTATPTNGCDFQANGTSSLTETVMRINYTVRLVGNAATAVTPQ